MNTDDASWTVSPHVRSTYSEDGAVLLDIEKGLCYSLNVVAARVWVTIEASPTGIDSGGIAEALETHFDTPRQELEADIAECLNKLESMALVQCNGRVLSSKASEGAS